MGVVGVISDTHDNLINVDKAVQVLDSNDVELVVHTGDIVSAFTLKRLSTLNCGMTGVFGNNDGDLILLRSIAEDLGFSLHRQPHEFDREGRKFVLIHGMGSGEVTREYASFLAAQGTYDVVIYGHTHKVEEKRVGETLLINPGEVFGLLTGKSTLMLLDIETLATKTVEL